MEIAKGSRIELSAKDDERVGPFLSESNLGLHSLHRARAGTRRLGQVRRGGSDPFTSIVGTVPESRGISGSSCSNKYEQVNSSIHHLSQTNAILRQKLEAKQKVAALTRENLMMLEELQSTNKQAILSRRKKEFIQREMEKGRRSAASAEDKLNLLRRIDENEARNNDKKIRADSVLGDLRKAKFRHLALMAQKRLQSVSPDLYKMQEEQQGLASQIDWYLRFCGEDNEDLPEESHDGTGTPN